MAETLELVHTSRKDELHNRWSAIELPTKRSRFGRSRPSYLIEDLIEQAPFGFVEGRVDLRGLTLTAETLITNSEVEKVDFSRASWNGVHLNQTQFHDVRFDNSKLTNMAISECLFDGASLAGTSLAGTHLGIRGGSFSNSTLDRCNWAKANLGSASFLRCEFSSMKGRVEPGAAAFADCSFFGLLESFEFRNGWRIPGDYKRFGSPPTNLMDGVDLSAATLSFVDFINVPLGNILLDETRQHRVVDWQTVVGNLLLLDDSTGVGRALAVLGVEQKSFILDLSWVEEEFGEVARSLVVAALESERDEDLDE